MVACARCGADAGAAPGYSSDGDVVCRRCATAELQGEADRRATEAMKDAALTPEGFEQVPDVRRIDDRAALPRRCPRCGQPSLTVAHVTAHFVNSIPAGRTYLHQCSSCSFRFRSESLWRAIRTVALGALLTLVGAAGGLTGGFGLVLTSIGLVGLLLLARSGYRFWRLRQSKPHAA